MLVFVLLTRPLKWRHQVSVLCLLVALVGGHRTSGFCSCCTWCLRESKVGPLQPLLSMFFATAASAPPSASPVGTTTSPGKNIDLEAVADARICTSNSIIIRKRYINTE